MPKIVLAFDIDDTLFNSVNTQELEWIGSQSMWVELCFRLRNRALAHGVEFHAAIATAKDRCDSRVIAAGIAFQDYLSMFHNEHQRPYPIVHHEYLLPQQYCEPTEGITLSDILSSIQVYQDFKSHSLKRIAKLYGLDDYSALFLVDDNPQMLDEAKNAGFSVISADEVCVQDKAQRDSNVAKLIDHIEKEISKKIQEIKPNPSLFFTHVPELTPLQKALMSGMETHEDLSDFYNSRKYYEI